MNEFANKTKQGYLVVDKMVKGKDVYVIIKRKDDYAVACGYDELTGTWRQGWYNYSTKEDAMVALVEEIWLFEQRSLIRTLLDYIQRGTEDSKEFLDILKYQFAMTDEEIMNYGKGYLLEN